MLRPRIFSLKEVQAMIPLVERIVKDITDTYKVLEAALIAADDASAVGDPAYTELDNEAKSLLVKMQGFIDELEHLGGNVKDMQVGLVDFYGDRNGEIVYYCWLPGEDIINFAHSIEKSCASRTALDMTKRSKF